VRRHGDGVVDPAPHPADLFLVELTGGSVPGDAVVMHRALHQAVQRLAATGVPIGWCTGLLLTDGRCLCLVEAGRAADVALACQTAAVPPSAVRPARALSGGSGPRAVHTSTAKRST
jgi:hypothetical protein